jgi:hypothetical protein
MDMTNKIELRYHCYDYDDNILHMDTKIIMENFVNNIWVETQISTTDFAEFRKNPLYRVPLKSDGTDDYDKAYSNFRDDGDSSIFLNDTIDAITNKRFAPSYQAFKQCLIDGELMAIITARGNHPLSIRRGIEYIIDTQLSKKEKNIMRKNLLKYMKIFKNGDDIVSGDTLLNNYLDNCEYIGVSSPYFKDLVIDENLCEMSNFNPNNTEVSKKIAMSYVVDKLHRYKLSDNYILKIGFSDDDIHNVKSIHDLFKNELKIKNNNTKFYIFDTSKNIDGSKNYKKISI